MENQQRSIRGYDCLARCYRPLEMLAFGNALVRARFGLIGQLGAPGRVLVLGDGDGRLLAELCDQYPQAEFVSVDQSPGMLRQQRNRAASVAAGHRVSWVQADALTWDFPKQQFDVVVAAFFLDCFDLATLRDWLPTMLGCIAAGGCLYYVDFTVPKTKWAAVYATAMLAVMHRFFAWQTGLRNRSLVDVPRLLGQLQWRVVAQADQHAGMITTRIYTRDQNQDTATSAVRRRG